MIVRHCIYFIAAFLFLQINSALAQEDKLLRKADDFFEKKNFGIALDIYKQAYEQNPQNPYSNQRIAQCLLETRDKNKALQYASDALKYTPKPSSEIYYTLAAAFHINHQFDSAKYYYLKSDIGNKNKKIIAKKVNECDFGKSYVDKPTDAKVSNAGNQINSPFSEYLPYITADRSKLYFTARRPDSKGGKKDQDGQYFEDIYSSINKGGAWEAAQNIGAPLNTDIHDACVGLSDDGQTMFVYKGSNGGDLYQSELKGLKWSNPTPMPINTEFFESTACLSADERTLFFVRKVMTGDRDIYMCSKIE
jgi:tetratricopeptide (TPR) repeat protein